MHKQSLRLRQITSLIDTAQDLSKRNFIDIIDAFILKAAAEELITGKQEC